MGLELTKIEEVAVAKYQSVVLVSENLFQTVADLYTSWYTLVTASFTG